MKYVPNYHTINGIGISNIVGWPKRGHIFVEVKKNKQSKGKNIRTIEMIKGKRKKEKNNKEERIHIRQLYIDVRSKRKKVNKEKARLMKLKSVCIHFAPGSNRRSFPLEYS